VVNYRFARFVTEEQVSPWKDKKGRERQAEIQGLCPSFVFVCRRRGGTMVGFLEQASGGIARADTDPAALLF
jgi:hypothetical protein